MSPDEIKTWQLHIKHQNVYQAAAQLEEEKQQTDPGLPLKHSYQSFIDKRSRYRFGQAAPAACDFCPKDACLMSPSPQVVMTTEFTSSPPTRPVKNQRCIPCQASNRKCTKPGNNDNDNNNVFANRLAEMGVDVQRSSSSRGRKTIVYFDKHTRMVDNSVSKPLHRIHEFAEALLRFFSSVQHVQEKPLQDLDLFLKQSHFISRTPPDSTIASALLQCSIEWHELVYSLIATPAAPLGIQRVLILWQQPLQELAHIEVNPQSKSRLVEQLTAIYLGSATATATAAPVSLDTTDSFGELNALSAAFPLHDFEASRAWAIDATNDTATATAASAFLDTTDSFGELNAMSAAFPLDDFEASRASLGRDEAVEPYLLLQVPTGAFLS
ncbi:uncharacterized protein SPSC_03858 [Sporisorium scitamineum]|uniref:Uncharacterized protein n=1 Tax=Sporisorium scitamineum TaxID=49012 RepID=A0A0F7S545_9BASI|nr:uncharacterized protein SPSC_03858 [Sporisorium scitamineum]CDW97456.1 hypothetical protein [Sporisorium scitamineum]